MKPLTLNFIRSCIMKYHIPFPALERISYTIMLNCPSWLSASLQIPHLWQPFSEHFLVLPCQLWDEVMVTESSKLPRDLQRNSVWCLVSFPFLTFYLYFCLAVIIIIFSEKLAGLFWDQRANQEPGVYIWLFSLNASYCVFIGIQASSAFYQPVLLLPYLFLFIHFYLS